MVKNYVFDPYQPLDVTFNLVEDLMDYATAAGSPYTEMQLMNITYNVINKTGVLKDGIKLGSKFKEDNVLRFSSNSIFIRHCRNGVK